MPWSIVSHRGLVGVSTGCPRATGMSLTRYAPFRRSPPEYCYPALPLDLHVLSLPLAFILSQDQTLHCIKNNVLLESWLLNFLKGIWQINTTFLFLSILPVIQRTNLKKSRDFPSRFGLQRYVIFFNPPNLFSRTFAFSFFAPSSENRIKLLFEQLFFSNADAKVGIILESANVLMIFISKNVIFLHLHPDTYL